MKPPTGATRNRLFNTSNATRRHSPTWRKGVRSRSKDPIDLIGSKEFVIGATNGEPPHGTCRPRARSYSSRGKLRDERRLREVRLCGVTYNARKSVCRGDKHERVPCKLCPQRHHPPVRAWFERCAPSLDNRLPNPCHGPDRPPLAGAETSGTGLGDFPRCEGFLGALCS